jgi:hypothetical protein
MPPKTKDESLVDIDDTGNAFDVHLPEEKKASEDSVVEVKENENVTEVVEEPKEEPKAEEAKPKEDTTHEKEIEEYSEGVQKRIGKLTRKLREAERQRDTATEYARNVVSEQGKLKTRLSTRDQQYLEQVGQSAKTGLDGATAQLKAAREAGDVDKEIEAQKLLAHYSNQSTQYENYKRYQDQAQTGKETPYAQPPMPRTPAAAPPDPKAEDWASKNSWFGSDEPMTFTAFSLHKKLVEDEGFDPKSDDYYQEIDKRIRVAFPHKFDIKEKEVSTKPSQTVASAKRSGSKAGRRTVRLTPSQVTIAKKLGVPLEEYAKYVNTEDRNNA